MASGPESSWSAALAPFRVPAYRRLWAGALFYAFGQWMERTAIGWFVLELTGSIFLSALAWAVRTGPFLVFGPIAILRVAQGSTNPEPSIGMACRR